MCQGGRTGREEKGAARESLYWADGLFQNRRTAPGDLVVNSCPKFCPVCPSLARTVDLDEGGDPRENRVGEAGWSHSEVGGKCL